MTPASTKEFLDIHSNYRVWIYSETRMSHDNNIQPIKPLYFFSPKDVLLDTILFQCRHLPKKNEKYFYDGKIYIFRLPKVKISLHILIHKNKLFVFYSVRLFSIKSAFRIKLMASFLLIELIIYGNQNL